MYLHFKFKRHKYHSGNRKPWNQLQRNSVYMLMMQMGCKHISGASSETIPNLIVRSDYNFVFKGANLDKLPIPSQSALFNKMSGFRGFITLAKKMAWRGTGNMDFTPSEK